MRDNTTEPSQSPEPAHEQTRRPEKPPLPDAGVPTDDREIAVERCPFAERDSA